MPKVSLIVSTLGRTKELERLLQSLERQEMKDFETVIVDQNGDDRLTPVLDRYRGALRLVTARSGRGLSRGRNTGLSLARGEIFAFPDDDCWYPPALLRRIVDLFAGNAAVALFSGKTVDAGFVNSLSAFDETSRAIDVRNVWRSGNSNTIFVRASADLRFDETLGVGSNTSFQSGEETDFLLRLLKAGVRMRYEPDILVHHDQIDLRHGDDGLRRARSYAPGLGRVLRLHRFPPLHVMWFATRPVGRAFLAALSGDMALARYKLAWARGLADGYLANVERVDSAVAQRKPSLR